MRILAGLAVLLCASGCVETRLRPFPWDRFEPEGRLVRVVYRLGAADEVGPLFDEVSGTLIAAEEDALYLECASPSHEGVAIPWSFVRAVLVAQPGLVRQTPAPRDVDHFERLVDPYAIAGRTRGTRTATPSDREQLKRLGRYPAGRPPAVRSRAWRVVPAGGEGMRW